MTDLRDRAKAMAAGAYLGFVSLGEPDEDALTELVADAMAIALEWAADHYDDYEGDLRAEAARLRVEKP